MKSRNPTVWSARQSWCRRLEATQVFRLFEGLIKSSPQLCWGYLTVLRQYIRPQAPQATLVLQTCGVNEKSATQTNFARRTVRIWQYSPRRMCHTRFAKCRGRDINGLAGSIKPSLPRLWFALLVGVPKHPHNLSSTSADLSASSSQCHRHPHASARIQTGTFDMENKSTPVQSTPHLLCLDAVSVIALQK